MSVYRSVHYFAWVPHYLEPSACDGRQRATRTRIALRVVPHWPLLPVRHGREGAAGEDMQDSIKQDACMRDIVEPGGVGLCGVR